MPRKTDGIIYELHPRPTKGEDGKPLLYAQPLIDKKYSVKELDELCIKSYYTHKHQIENTLNVACEAIATLLKEGRRVETPFGTFAPKLRLLGDHTDPDRVTGKDIMYAGIEFTPSKTFESLADCSQHGFRKQDPRIWKPKKVEGDEALKEALLKSMVNGYTTAKRFMIYSGLKETMARRYLNAHCEGENALLSRYIEGRTVQYRLKQPLPPVKR